MLDTMYDESGFGLSRNASGITITAFVVMDFSEETQRADRFYKTRV